MKKMNIKLSILCLFLVSVFSFNADYLWFTSNQLGINLFRMLLVVLLFILLVTDPPRNKYLRATLFLVSLATTCWTLGIVKIGVDVQLGDWMSLLLAGITLGHSALELDKDRSLESNQLANTTSS